MPNLQVSMLSSSTSRSISSNLGLSVASEDIHLKPSACDTPHCVANAVYAVAEKHAIQQLIKPHRKHKLLDNGTVMCTWHSSSSMQS